MEPERCASSIIHACGSASSRLVRRGGRLVMEPERCASSIIQKENADCVIVARR